MNNNTSGFTHRKSSPAPSSIGEMNPRATETPGESIDEHRRVETGNIILTGDEIKQQNENL